MNMGQRIKRKRIELGLSQEELAKRLGYSSRASINKVEKGTTELTQSKIIEFSKVLNVSIDYLFDTENNVDFFSKNNSNNGGTIIENNGSGDGNNSNNVTHNSSTVNNYYENESCTNEIIITKNTKKYFFGIIDNIREMNDNQLLDVLKYTDYINKKEK